MLHDALKVIVEENLSEGCLLFQVDIRFNQTFFQNFVQMHFTQSYVDKIIMTNYGSFQIQYKCAGAISSHTKGLGNLVKLMKPLSNHLIILNSQEKPLERSLALSKRPIVWVPENGQHPMKYCPRVLKQKSSVVKKLLFNRIECPNFIAGQNLVLGFLSGPPSEIIDSKGNTLGGYLINMYKVLAKQFGFQPVFMRIPSVYFPNNQTWLGGAKMVCFLY